MRIQRRLLFAGQVQGVGFRMTARHLAQDLDVQGYVQNLPDGRVELVAEGPADQIDELVARIRQRLAGYIYDVRSHDAAPTGEFSAFVIRH